jgi:hypothetical protein
MAVNAVSGACLSLIPRGLEIFFLLFSWLTDLP